MYEQIFLLGSSQLAKKCLTVLKQQTPRHIPVTYLDTDTHKKAELMQLLAEITAPALIFSIMNPYIFTAGVTARPNLTIVNLHHGILPGHRGRNAQAWAIFYEEEEAGITWHLVDEGVDTGQILHIERIPIHENDTALSLMKKQNLLVPESLNLLLPQLLSGEIQAGNQEAAKPARDYFHLNRDIPGGGILDPGWSGRKISCFLRAMDFGILKVLGTPVLKWKGGMWEFSSYQIKKAEDNYEPLIIQNGNDICIKKDSFQITLRKVRQQLEKKERIES